MPCSAHLTQNNNFFVAVALFKNILHHLPDNLNSNQQPEIGWIYTHALSSLLFNIQLVLKPKNCNFDFIPELSKLNWQVFDLASTLIGFSFI